MKRNNYGKTVTVALVAILGVVTILIPFVSGASAETSVPMNYDNQGKKIFDAQRSTTDVALGSASSGRNIVGYYDLRQYPGSPPKIPHRVEPAFSDNEMDCLSCHEQGGYSPEFGKFIPVTPHPENVLCYQCHAKVETTELFVETDWKSIQPPRLGQSFLPGAPPPIPHSLQLRENCIACHTGPAAVAEIKISHVSRGDCRQCHAPAVQTAPFKVFQRK